MKPTALRFDGRCIPGRGMCEICGSETHRTDEHSTCLVCGSDVHTTSEHGMAGGLTRNEISEGST